jgi:hypothetical protein
MPNQQKYNPISFRPPEGDRVWLTGHASATSRPVNAILAEALAEYRVRREHGDEKLTQLDFADPKQTREALEHARAALARDNEGIRLWMLDCGELVAKHRARADAAEAELAQATAATRATGRSGSPSR